MKEEYLIKKEWKLLKVKMMMIVTVSKSNNKNSRLNNERTYKEINNEIKKASAL
jgi:hypothetical protein